MAKINSSVSISANNVVYGNDVTISANVLPNDATGNISYIVYDKNGKEIASATKVIGDIYSVSGLGGGSYSVVGTYQGDEKYNSSESITNFNVTKASSYVSAIISGASYGDNVTIIVNVFTDETGETVTGDFYYEICDENGIVVATGTKNISDKLIVSSLNGGKYTLTASYKGDNNFNGSKGIFFIFNVGKINPPISISLQNVSYGQEVKIIANLPSDATGTLTYQLNDRLTETLSVGEYWTISNLVPENYIVTAKYNGDCNYNNISNSASFKVHKLDPKINITIETISNKAIINITAPKDATGNVTVSINGVNKTYDIKKFESEVLTLENLDMGTYVLSVSYSGDTIYTNQSKTTSFIIYGLN
ncbi:MAG: Ig-like domain-containing protein [archaeon]|nr:Ig-like domain-containing protein [archaeon]